MYEMNEMLMQGITVYVRAYGVMYTLDHSTEE